MNKTIFLMAFAMIFLMGSVSADLLVVSTPDRAVMLDAWAEDLYSYPAVNFTNLTNIYDDNINTFSYIIGDGIQDQEFRGNLLELYYDVPENTNLSESYAQITDNCQTFNISLANATLNGTQIKVGVEVLIYLGGTDYEGGIYTYIFTETDFNGEQQDFGKFLSSNEFCQTLTTDLDEVENGTRVYDVTVFFSYTPTVAEETNEGNLIQGTGQTYEVLKSSGSGLGIFIGYMTAVLPVLLIGVGFAFIIFLVGVGIVSAIKSVINKVNK